MSKITREAYYGDNIYPIDDAPTAGEALARWADPSGWEEEDGKPPRVGEKVPVRDHIRHDDGSVETTDWYSVKVEVRS